MIHRLSLIWVLFWHNFAPRNKSDRLQIVWVILEPIGQMAVLLMVFTLIGRTPAYGRSFALFLLTGVAMLTHFTRGSAMVMGAIKTVEKTSRPPGVGLFHEAIARILFKLTIGVIYTAALFWAVAEFAHVDTMPHHWVPVVEAFFWMTLLAFGVGLLRAHAQRFAPFAERAYTILSRVLLFVSGVFYVPSFMPPQIRDWLAWNPVLHGVELFRLGVYAEYPTIVYDPLYFKGFALGTTALGMGLLWRRRAEVMG